MPRIAAPLALLALVALAFPVAHGALGCGEAPVENRVTVQPLGPQGPLDAGVVTCVAGEYVVAERHVDVSWTATEEGLTHVTAIVRADGLAAFEVPMHEVHAYTLNYFATPVATVGSADDYLIIYRTGSLELPAGFTGALAIDVMVDGVVVASSLAVAPAPLAG